MSGVKLLDCTLRDGAYIVDAKFGTPAIKGIIKKSQDADIDIIECGWLKNNEHVEGTSFFHVPSDVIPYLAEKKEGATYVTMIDWDRYDLSYLPQCDGKSIDAIRVVFPHGKFREGIAVGKVIREKGYEVYYQAANTLAYSEEDLVALANEVNEIDAKAISVVDTFGAMYADDLDRIVRILNEHVRPEIAIGFHSHNNQQLSFALTMQFVELNKELGREAIVDASLCGMGRGAGNATTELVANYLNTKHNKNYDMDAIMDAIDIYMTGFQKNYSWGYSTPYFIAGMYCCHVNNIAYLLDNHRANARDMRQIISSLSPEDRLKYDYDLLESKYVENQLYVVDDEANKLKLMEEFKDREILLIAPGSMALTRQTQVKAYIKEHNPVVVAVNALLEGYDYDYLFLTNSARYEYASQVHSEAFAKTKKLLLSNIKTNGNDDEIVFNYNTVIKRGWKHFDNAVILCLRLMNKVHAHSIALAGFDGFSNKYNESYADKSLPSLYQIEDWEELNREIADIFADVKNTANHIRNISFITDSVFDK